MKYFFITLLFLSNYIFSDYSKHPEAKEVIATLVRDHGFEKSYVVKVLESAKGGILFIGLPSKRISP